MSRGAAIGSTWGGSAAAGVVATIAVAAVVGAAVDAGAATVVGVNALVEELATTVEVTSAASTWAAMVVAGDVATRLALGVFAALIASKPTTAVGINARFRFHQVRACRSTAMLDV